MANNQSIAEEILKNIGGSDNVKNLTHCMTRLRFVLKDESKANDEGIKNIDGVMGLRKQGGQYQVIVGNNVSKTYTELMKLGVSGGAKSNEPVEKKKLTFKQIGINILDAIIGTMSPLIPAIIGGSMIKLLAMLLSMTGILSEESSTFNILNTIGDAPFFFLPMLVAVSAARKFNSNVFLALAVAGVMVHPEFMDIMLKASEGKEATFAFIPVMSVKYTYTIIPAIVMTWLLKYIEDFADRITPIVMKNFLKPMLILLIAAPIAIIIVGPSGILIGTGLSQIVFFVHDKLGFLAVAIVGALWPLLVMTGMHRVFTPTIVQTIAETGKEGMVMPSEIGANLSLGGVSLAVAFKTKNRELRQTSLAAASSAIIAGITEPALYGVAIRLKRPMIASVITGFIAGAVAGLAGLASHSMAAPGLFTSVQFIDQNNPMSIFWVIVVMVLSIVISFVLTLILGFEDIPESEDELLDLGTKDDITVAAPVEGRVKPIESVEDDVFSREVIGKSIAIEPTGNTIYAPVTGTVTSVFPTKHAIGITGDDGIEVLIHVGIDTVKLDGGPFISVIEEGDHVNIGDVIGTFDLEQIIEAGYDPTTIVVITNTDDYDSITSFDRDDVQAHTSILGVVK
ncbi:MULTISPECIES: PTS cellobiose/arbutin/salicin transporter subunit IIBC [Mammaliicoccus]|uniref:PTS cellobiose/arbutin/salicin transporter subunit IIBC n=1 Tax=Mammaliicoccus lentus TaxID=42858 RepID=A0ABS6GVF9_MAMLE|nr:MULTISPECIES: PTS cellobiose/arbutin/salicin transporter subunit IIBC [Mammaliicoccus]MBF0748921.1 PTS cellobiose/arbutin/salicin transporter subunit IIBC [Mammaliicoccus lentus]MBU6113442.1 PTS cellobiose/arbutin/salicin transporter subunit IIBC [Mammaliicoccus lentus]MBW0762225.1 PTS cellobiose/arbutin/salicin transporter subunit IIBC [Mammaliicoccus lentus]MBW0766244.1 PTS cellobiose/arbutin/salicin transporter subunit IIBC [Mammaliicoccus lentus]MDQ7143665.1 PTS cellobiose/arbutin/salic